jgi:pimeloyl-ACP methyl ester carboxylesterase
VYAGRHPEHVRSIVLDAGYPIAYDAWGLDKLAAARRGVRLVCAARARVAAHPRGHDVDAGHLPRL